MVRTYRVADVTEELKRQIVIQNLMEMGIKSYKGKHVSELEYNEARHVLVMARLKKEGL
mgnify:CR=1 FL=1